MHTGMYHYILRYPYVISCFPFSVQESWERTQEERKRSSGWWCKDAFKILYLELTQLSKIFLIMMMIVVLFCVLLWSGSSQRSPKNHWEHACQRCHNGWNGGWWSSFGWGWRWNGSLFQQGISPKDYDNDLSKNQKGRLITGEQS